MKWRSILTQVFKLTNADGSKTEVFMSYGLLNAVCRTVGEIDGAAVIVLDNDMRDAILSELLSARGPTGDITEALNLFALPYAVEEIEGLLDWTQGHVISFFMKSAVSTAERMFPIKQQMADLQVSLAGTPASK